MLHQVSRLGRYTRYDADLKYKDKNHVHKSCPLTRACNDEMTWPFDMIALNQ